MRSLLLVASLAVLPRPALSEGCGCERLCAKSTVKNCVDKCLKVCTLNKTNDQDLRTGHLGGMDNALKHEDLKDLTEVDLKRWAHEYERRRQEFFGRCQEAKADDPNIAQIRDRCASTLAGIVAKRDAIQAELERRRAQPKTDPCAKPEQLTDAQYCKEYRCGECMVDSRNHLVPLPKAKARLAREKADGEAARAAREKREPRGTAPGAGGGSVDCASLRARHEAACSAFDERSKPTRAQCFANARRTAEAECLALRTKEGNERR